MVLHVLLNHEVHPALLQAEQKPGEVVAACAKKIYHDCSFLLYPPAHTLAKGNQCDDGGNQLNFHMYNFL